MDIKEILKKEFKERKLKAEYNADINLTKVFDQFPEFKNLYNSIRSLQLDYAKLKYSGQDTIKVVESIKKLKADLKAFANSHNIDLTTLKPQYNCNKCKDSGIINNTPCECFNAELSKALLGASGLQYSNLPDFDTMSYDIISDPKQKQNYSVCCNIFKEYIAKLKTTDKKLFLLSGQVGVGKTHILKATTHEAIKNGYFALYTTAFDLNKSFLNYHCAKLDEKDAILDKYLSCDLLLIDDLGTENKLNNVTVEYLYLIINQRLETGKNTIITTNLNMSQLKDMYDERIMSRISNKKTCVQATMQGNDLRIN